MWGADDPDCRKPMVWDDLSYEDERTAFNPAKFRLVDSVRPDTALRFFYKKLCRMRKENPVLVYGDLSFSVVDDKNMVLAYNRVLGDEEIAVVFNRSDSLRMVTVPVRTDGEFEDMLSGKRVSFISADKKIGISLNPLSGIVLKKKGK
jgi:glycosidase